MDPSTWLALLSLSCLAAGQTYSPLSPALIYTEGAFTSPDNTVQQTYQNGSTMVISWYANYTTINLFQVFNNDYSIQWGLASTHSHPCLCLLGPSTDYSPFQMNSPRPPSRGS